MDEFEVEMTLRYEQEIDCIVQFDALTGREIETYSCNGVEAHQAAKDMGLAGEWA